MVMNFLRRLMYGRYGSDQLSIFLLVVYILFTILSGVGMTNDSALMAYSLILAINRPIEMLCTSLNVVGDSCTCLYVAKSENLLNEEVYNANLHELAAPATAETA